MEGFRALAHGAPDMNSLVGLGATASFAISAAAALLPQLGALMGVAALFESLCLAWYLTRADRRK